MSNREIPAIEPVAPIIDRLVEVAHEEIEAPRTLDINAYEDGDIHIRVFHSLGPTSGEQIIYDPNTDEVRRQYWRGRRQVVDEEANEETPNAWGTPTTEEFDEWEEQVITTIEVSR
jgi:hypothetical protein